MIFIEVVLPIFIIFFAAYALQRKFNWEMKPLSQLLFYLLVPTLVFKTLFQVDIQGDLKHIVIFQIIFTIAMVFVIKGIALVKKMESQLESAMILGIVFMNSGNYGIAFNLFAFGEDGFQLAITFWVFQAILMNSLGVYFANRHSASINKSFKAVLRMPTFYAALAGLGFQLLNFSIPSFLFMPIDLLSNATIPILMILLGMQLAQVKLADRWKPISLGVFLRLIISPVVAIFIVSYLLPTEGLLAKVLIVQAAMPSAVVTTLLAVQYKTEPDVVSGITLFSTLFSMITLTVLLIFVNAYF